MSGNKRAMGFSRERPPSLINSATTPLTSAALLPAVCSRCASISSTMLAGDLEDCDGSLG
eukprot:11642924-Karenia_brevis.AAC.1